MKAHTQKRKHRHLQASSPTLRLCSIEALYSIPRKTSQQNANCLRKKHKIMEPSRVYKLESNANTQRWVHFCPLFCLIIHPANSGYPCVVVQQTPTVRNVLVTKRCSYRSTHQGLTFRHKERTKTAWHERQHTSAECPSRYSRRQRECKS